MTKGGPEIPGYPSAADFPHFRVLVGFRRLFLRPGRPLDTRVNCAVKVLLSA